MDSDELCKIEFIDLNGVEENEKIRIRNSLQNYDSSVKLPWIREKKHSKTENQPESPNPQQQQQHFIIQPSPLPPPPSLFYNQQMVTYAAHPHPSNVIYYPSNVNVFPPALAHSHPQRIFVTAQPAFTAPTNPGFFTVQSNVEEMLENGVGNDHSEINGICKETENEEVEEEEIKNEEHQKVEETEIKNEEEEEMSTNLENVSENDNKPLKKNEEKPLKKEEKSVNFPANKSWASLFNSSSSSTTAEKRENPEKLSDNLQENFVIDKKLEENRPFCPIKHPRKAQQFIDPDCYRMAEFLQAYVIDANCKNLFQPRGLLNQSNYCYINSILQALIACPPMANLLVGLSAAAPAALTNDKRKPTPMIDGMCRFVKEFKLLPPNQRNTKEKRAEKNTKKDVNANTAHLANTDVPFEPTWIYKMLNGLRTDLIEGRQEDAEEFLGVLLNGLNDEMLELLKLVKNNEEEEIEIKMEIEEVGEKEWKVMGPKNKGSVTRRTDFDRTPIRAIFGGLLRSRVHRTGDLSTENIQPFLTLQLNIEKVKTVREALDALVSKHQLEGVTSSKTNEQVEAYQQVLLDELPIILILHLKCFDYKQDGCTKIVKQLEFGVDLRIDQKLLSSKPQSQREKHYKLFAIIYHDGKEASKGHYVTDAFHVGLGCWLRYDDAAVKTVSEEAVLKPHGSRVPYLLFYRRADSILRK